MDIKKMKDLILRAILLITVLFLTIFQPYQILIYSQTGPSKQITPIEVEQSPVEVVEQYCQRWIAGDTNGMYQFLGKPTIISKEEFAQEMARSTTEGTRPLKIIKIEEPQFTDSSHATVGYSLQVPPAWGKPDGVAKIKAYLTIGADKLWGISGTAEISEPKVIMSPEESKLTITGLMEIYCNAWLKGDVKTLYKYLAKPTIISEEQFAKDMAIGTAEGARPLKIIKIEEPEFSNPSHATVVYSFQVPPAWGKPDGVAKIKAYLTIGADKLWGISGTAEISEPKVIMSPEESKLAITSLMEKYCNAWLKGDTKTMYQFLGKPTIVSEEQFAKEMAWSTAEGARPLKIIKIEEPQFSNPFHATVVYSLQVPAAWGNPDSVVKNKAYLMIGGDKLWGISGNVEVSLTKD